MDNFKQIDYKRSLEIFKKAELTGRRLKLGDFKTSKWLQKENISLEAVRGISQQYPDLRICIIGEGEAEGFYIYSQKQETCLKFEAALIEMK